MDLQIVDYEAKLYVNSYVPYVPMWLINNF